MAKLRNQILPGDCIEILRQAKKPFADLIFADPPFNIGHRYDKCHDKKASAKYLARTEDWIGGWDNSNTAQSSMPSCPTASVQYGV